MAHVLVGSLNEQVMKLWSEQPGVRSAPKSDQNIHVHEKAKSNKNSSVIPKVIEHIAKYPNHLPHHLTDSGGKQNNTHQIKVRQPVVPAPITEQVAKKIFIVYNKLYKVAEIML